MGLGRDVNGKGKKAKLERNDRGRKEEKQQKESREEKKVDEEIGQSWGKRD